MALPLYREVHGATLGNDAHRGLWWSRFFDGYSADFGKPGEGENGKFIEAISRGRYGDANQIESSAKRISRLAENLGGESRCFISQGRFATGMGNDHPTENGFTWHPTLGVPYLPASSVKGMVRGWLEWQWGKDALRVKGGNAEKRKQLLSWFGSEHKDPRECEADQRAGWFVFFDALPTEPVQLAADVMTPHYDKWYEKGGGNNSSAPDTVPADWHSPVPVPFLTVKKTTMQFAVAVRPGLHPDELQLAKAALTNVMVVLAEALEWAGAGAKTATGYGRFAPDPEEEKRRERERQVQAEKERLATELRALESAAEAEASRLAAMSPMDRKLELELAKPAYKGLPSWQAWLNTLNVAGLWEPAEARELAQRIRGAMEAEGFWLPEEKSKRGERCRKVLAWINGGGG